MKVIEIVKRGWFSDTVRLEAEWDEAITVTRGLDWNRYTIKKNQYTTVRLPKYMKLQMGDAVSLEKLELHGQTHGLCNTCGRK